MTPCNTNLASIEYPLRYPSGRGLNRFTNRLGQQFGQLTVIQFVRTRLGKPTQWVCVCDCGTAGIFSIGNLVNGNTKSCGCRRFNVGRTVSITHGATVGQKRTPEFRSYSHAKSRCTNPNVPNYERYGGRGIEFRFTSYPQFLEAIGKKPSPAHSLDRIDNGGHYEPGNVRWATAKEQANNRRPRRRKVR